MTRAPPGPRSPSEIRLRGRPGDAGRSDGRAERPAFGVGETQAANQSLALQCCSLDVVGYGVQPEFGPTKHGERAVVADYAPRQVNESLERPALDVWSAQVQRSRRNNLGSQ